MTDTHTAGDGIAQINRAAWNSKRLMWTVLLICLAALAVFVIPTGGREWVLPVVLTMLCVAGLTALTGMVLGIIGLRQVRRTGHAGREAGAVGVGLNLAYLLVLVSTLAVLWPQAPCRKPGGEVVFTAAAWPWIHTNAQTPVVPCRAWPAG